MNPKISIIIPVYKVEDYIERCLLSVLNQTVKGFEVIIVDDCSPDRSMQKVEEILNSHSIHGIGFKILHHEKNRGLSASRNTGIKYASGEYLYFLDSDDYINDICIESFMKVQNKHPNVDLIQGEATSNKNEISKAIALNGRHLPEYTEDSKCIEKGLLNSKIIPVTAWNKLVCRDFVTNNNLFFTEGIIHEDVLWCFHVGKYISNMATNSMVTYIYWQRNDSIMTSFNIEKEYYSCFFIIRDMMEALTPRNRFYQKVRLFKIFLHKLEQNNFYVDRKQREEVLRYLKSKSNCWGRGIITLWDASPKCLKNNKYWMAVFYNLYGCLG